MPLLVDGNNVMGQRPGWHRDKSAARRRLLAELAKYFISHRGRVTVVFDGAPEDGIPDGVVLKGVKVYFPPPGGDADSIIIQLVKSARDPRGVTVVTSDRELRDACKSQGAKVIPSGEFRKRLDALSGDSEQGDIGDDSTPNTDSVEEWLEYFEKGPSRPPRIRPKSK